MPEQRITVTIDEQGNLSATTAGFTGEACLDELEALLGDVADLQDVKKTDAYFQQQTIKQRTKLSQRKK